MYFYEQQQHKNPNAILNCKAVNKQPIFIHRYHQPWKCNMETVSGGGGVPFLPTIATQSHIIMDYTAFLSRPILHCLWLGCVYIFSYSKPQLLCGPRTPS